MKKTEIINKHLNKFEKPTKYLNITFSYRLNKFLKFKKNIIEEHNELSYDIHLLFFRIYYLSKTNLPF
jgi:hypothetical protein